MEIDKIKQLSVLDACSLINLIHIDDDDYLIKEIKKRIQFLISGEVYKELENNITKKFKIYDLNNIRYNYEEIKRVKDKVIRFVPFQVKNEEIEKDLGDLFRKIGTAIDYKGKYNGEYYSTALSLIKSRENESKYFFYTDDFGVKSDYNIFFVYQQIGQINDSVDLLIFLYWNSESFTLSLLKMYLSSLAYQYSIELKCLTDKLQDMRETLPLKLRRDKTLSKLLFILIGKIKKFEFEGIGKIKEELFISKSKYKLVCQVLKQYYKVFELENKQKENLLTKAIRTIKYLDKNEIYKLA